MKKHIHYNNIPKDIWDFITSKKAELQQKLGNGKIGFAYTITHIIRDYIKIKND